MYHQKDESDPHRTAKLFAGLFFLIGVVALVVVLVLDDASNSETETPLMEIIAARGALRCGVPVSAAGFAAQKDGSWEGFDIDLCKAVAAAIGSEVTVEYTGLTSSERFTALASGEVDMLARITTWTMERDVHQADAGTGFAFSTPYFYDGVGYGGNPTYVTCAENRDVEGPCAGLSVCVRDGTTHVSVLRDLFPSENIEVKSTYEEMATALFYGPCQVIATESYELAESSVRAAGLDAAVAYTVGSVLVSKEPLAMVTRQDNAHWSDFVNWVLQALLTAEEQGITQAAATNFTVTATLPSAYKGAFVRAIAKVGHYGEMYARNLQSVVPRSPLNSLNDGTTGLIYSYPFGTQSTVGPDLAGTAAAVRERGFLRCGITERKSFAELDANLQWSGFDVDYCRAISAALFDGAVNVVYVVLPAKGRFKALAAGEVDVLSRLTTHTLERDVLEPDTKQGFSFSTPNFYDGLSFGGLSAFAVCADNTDVSGACAGLKICVADGTTFLSRVQGLFPEANVIIRSSSAAVLGGFVSGACNVVSGGKHDVAESSVRSNGYSGEYTVGTKTFSKDPLALVTRQDDPRWSDFVQWVYFATVHAAESGITQAQFKRMPLTSLFGGRHGGMLRSVVRAVGNYDELYNRHVYTLLGNSTGGINSLNKLSSPNGQFYPLPGFA